MKRVLTLTTTGLFVTGLALLPMSVRADQTVNTGKDVKSAPMTGTAQTGTSHTSTTVTPAAPRAVTPPHVGDKAPVVAGTHAPAAAMTKPDDKKALVAPSVGGTTTTTTVAPVKTPEKGS